MLSFPPFFPLEDQKAARTNPLEHDKIRYNKKLRINKRRRKKAYVPTYIYTCSYFFFFFFFYKKRCQKYISIYRSPHSNNERKISQESNPPTINPIISSYWTYLLFPSFLFVLFLLPPPSPVEMQLLPDTENPLW